MNINKFMKDFVCDLLSNQSNTNKKKRKYTKRTFKEKDCDVYYDPSWLFAMYYPGEYVDFEEI